MSIDEKIRNIVYGYKVPNWSETAGVRTRYKLHPEDFANMVKSLSLLFKAEVKEMKKLK